MGPAKAQKLATCPVVPISPELSRQEDLLRAMAAAGPRCGFGEQFCRAVITGKGGLSIAKGDRTTIKRCLENFDKAPDGKDLALGAALSASTEKSAHKGCFNYYNYEKREWQTDELPDRRHCNAPPAKRGSQSSIIMKRSGVRNPPPAKKHKPQRRKQRAPWLYASVSTYKTHLLIKGFLDEESKNIWICMVERASYANPYDGTGPIARLRRAEEALIEQTLKEMAVRAHAATASEAASVADALNKRGCLAWDSLGTLNPTDPVPSEFRRAIIADPKNAMAHLNLGVILWFFHERAGSLPEAHLRRAIKINPKCPFGHRQLAQYLESICDYRGAHKHFRHVRQQQEMGIGPKNGWSNSVLEWTHHEQKYRPVLIWPIRHGILYRPALRAALMN